MAGGGYRPGRQIIGVALLSAALILASPYFYRATPPLRHTTVQIRASEKKRTHVQNLADLGADMFATNATKMCHLKTMGAGWGAHALCDSLRPRSDCTFYSYGISSDYSFDAAVADEWGCQGVALDPSVEHKSKLHPNVTFHMFAARSLDKEADHAWNHVTTVPGLKKFLGHDKIDILKMDCEGCEYALAEDILREDPTFLRQVDQLAIELHVSQKWLKTDHHALQLGMLYGLAKDAGLNVVDTHFGGCNPVDEAVGCLPLLLDVGFPCDKGMMCVDVLFARV